MTSKLAESSETLIQNVDCDAGQFNELKPMKGEHYFVH